MLEMRTIHHRDGESITLPSVDANDAISNHPDEWSYQPWTSTQKTLGERDPTISPYAAGPSRRT